MCKWQCLTFIILFQGPRLSLEKHLEESCQQHLTLMCNVVSKQQHQITSLKSALSRLSLNYSGTLIWKISDFVSKMNEAKTKEGMELVSPPFYTSQYGYKLQVKIVSFSQIINVKALIDKYIKMPNCPSTMSTILEFDTGHSGYVSLLTFGSIS